MNTRSLAQWLALQASLHPSQIALGLERVGQVWQALGSPRIAARIVVVAGTNGKGSSVAMLDAIFRAAGYRVGRYTSPHLLRYNERVCLQGRAVDDARLCAAFQRIEAARIDIPLTYFEFGTLAALLIFSEAALDLAVLEVGLGGRMDAVNIIAADVALITPIGLDHQHWLGNDRESIAAEKAGIMRTGRDVVHTGVPAPAAILARAAELAAPLYLLGRDFHARRQPHDRWDWLAGDSAYPDLPLPALQGAHQLDNAAGALMVIDRLQPQLPVDLGAIRAGLEAVRLPGRLEFFPGAPAWLFDVAHNPMGVAVLAGYLRKMPVADEVIGLFAVLEDKDPRGIAEVMNTPIHRWVLPELDAPRAMPAGELEAQLREAGIRTPIDRFATVAEAVESLHNASPDNALIVVFGSFHTVGKAMRRFRSLRVQSSHGHTETGQAQWTNS